MMRRLLLLLLFPVVLRAQDIQTGLTLSDGVQYHAADFNNTINNATILPTFISGKGVGIPISTDSIVYFQGSSSTLKKGTVSSLLSAGAISLTMPSGFVVAGSPAAGTGTLAVTLSTQSPNFALLGPAVQGTSAAAPTWRAINPHDTSVASETGTGVNINCAGFRTFSRTLSANTTYALLNMVDGEAVTVAVKQAAAGGPYTAGFSSVTWKGGGAPTMTATANHVDLFGFVKVGSVIYGVASQNYF